MRTYFKILIIIAASATIAAGCFHVDDQKYKVLYMKNFSKPIDKITQKGFEEADTPTPSVYGTEKAPGSTTLTAAPASITMTPAATSTPESVQKANNRLRQIDISSDNLNYNKQDETAVFKGHVTVLSSDIVMYCDTLKAKNFQKDANADGHIRLIYKKEKLRMKCDRLTYGDNMNIITGYDNVVATKILEDGNTLTIYSDQVQFDTNQNLVTADKVKKQVKILMKDVVAFSDKVVYNENERKVYLKGSPYVRKKSSSFIADIIVLDVDKKSIRMKSNIWSKLFYGEFENTQKEVEIETSKDKSSRKNLQ